VSGGGRAEECSGRCLHLSDSVRSAMRRSKGVRSGCGRAATSRSVTAGVCTHGDVCPEDEADSAGAACRCNHCTNESTGQSVLGSDSLILAQEAPKGVCSLTSLLCARFANAAERKLAAGCRSGTRGQLA
jgi:hypothetical protein